MRVQSLHPEAMRAHLDLYTTLLLSRSGLRRAERELIAVVVSAANGCAYCFRHHAEALRALWKGDARATNVTPEVLHVTGKLVGELWKGEDGRGRPYPYQKAGVLLLDLTRATPAQGHLFMPEREDMDELMAALDAVNRRFGKRRFGKRSVFMAAEGVGRQDTETGQDWAMRRQMKSPAYTTRWEDLVTVYAR